MKLNLPFALLLLFASINATAQNVATKWIFGAYAGLDFMTSPPTTVISPTMMAPENSCSVADANGNLLFYTNSQEIWNSAHTTMANGGGIMGNWSSAQSMVLKQPGSSTIYHVFTLDDAGGPDGLRYSTVDMSLAAGMGSVTTKNVLLYAPSSEKMSAVRHCNGTDLWLLSHDANSNAFKAHLVTAAGVSMTPVTTSIGTIYPGAAWAGLIKCSPNGRKVAAAVPTWPTPYFEIYDFDNSTGVLSGLQTLAVPSGTAAGGCEFSPDGTKLYASIMHNSTIIQWDLCANNASTTIQSQLTGQNNYLGAPQLAPDGKIYVSRAGSATLAVVNNPNAAGMACNYADMGPILAPNGLVQPTCQLGLPAFPAHLFLKLPTPTFTYAESCQSATFTPGPTVCSGSGLSVLNRSWNFGDPASGTANTSAQNAPSHLFQAAGTYTIKLITYYNCYSDTAVTSVTIGASAPTLNVAGTYTICKGQSTTYTASGANTYSWSTGSINPVITVTPTGNAVYSVTATHTVNSCKAAKVFTVYVSPCTGLEQHDASKDPSLLVYPNPAQGKLTVETEKEGKLTVYNQLGELIMEQTVLAGKNSLDLSKAGNGLYFLKYSGSAGEKMARLIKAD
jgi:hypothetical protein